MQIKRLSLLSRLIVADDYNNWEYIKTLYKFIIADMQLDNVILAILNNIKAGIEGKDKGQYKWFI